MTLKTGVMVAENSALHLINKLHSKIYANRKLLFLIVKIFHNITIFIAFFAALYKYSLGEHKRLISKTLIIPKC